jgi:uncharacterized SAM-binding protein YcdF (DUF218 family)
VFVIAGLDPPAGPKAYPTGTRLWYPFGAAKARQSIILNKHSYGMDTRVKPAYDDLDIFEGLPLFFVLSKTLGIIALPTNFLILLGVAGAILLLTRLAPLGRKLLVGSVLLLAICGFSPFGNILLYPLEERFPPWDATRGAPDGIVVLGGAVETEASEFHGETALNASAGRMIAAAMLARRYPNARILFSGGSANLIGEDSHKEADYVAALFEGLGISRDRLTLERLSRNTFENAEFSRALAAPKAGERWLLVTSAFHMPRSVGIFRKVGFAVEPYPTDWRLAGPADLLRLTAFSVEGLQHTDLAVREWIGLLAYWLTGKTSELFPAPAVYARAAPQK